MMVATAIIMFHFPHPTIRIVTKHDAMYIAWFLFDWTVSPFYELVKISQVKICINYIKNGFHVLQHVVFEFSEESRRYFCPHNFIV